MTPPRDEASGVYRIWRRRYHGDMHTTRFEDRAEIRPSSPKHRRFGIRLVLTVLGLFALVGGGFRVYALIGTSVGGGPTQSGHPRRDVYADANGLVAWYRFDGDPKDSST